MLFYLEVLDGVDADAVGKSFPIVSFFIIFLRSFASSWFCVVTRANNCNFLRRNAELHSDPVCTDLILDMFPQTSLDCNF